MGCESKLDKIISNAELFPPGKQIGIKHEDRNKHGGGVFFAFKDGYVTSHIGGQ